MKKYKCKCCGRCFYPQDAEEVDELVTTDAWAGPQYGYPAPACPECYSKDLEELNIWNQACIEYDEEYGCQGDCEECPLMTDTEEDDNDNQGAQ